VKEYARVVRKIFWKNFPEQIIFFVTAMCNLNCKMCFYDTSRRKDELSIEEIKKISSKMPRFYWLQISGGEPFLRPDLHEICSTFAKNNQVRAFNIPTNGYFVDKVVEQTRKMVESNPEAFFNIGISVLGIKEVHEEITGKKGSFDKAIQCYQRLHDLKKHHSNLGLHFTGNQNVENEKTLKQLFDFLMKEYSPEHLSFNLERGVDLNHKYSDSSLELFRENWIYLLNLVYKRKGYYFKLPLKSLFYAIHILQKDIVYKVACHDKFVIPCYAARISAVIDETGNLYSCEMRKISLGRFRESGYDFQSIWQGDVAKLERKDIKENRCFCTHECFITTNIVFNPQIYPRLFLKLSGYITKRVLIGLQNS
jgi:sulfatase maturation enzyme AslB (radical SAM superfamily)|tara:strand:+ start:5420 stop:6520 length:1101 start_codon:yes stop_codon:yes gene_type:complete